MSCHALRLVYDGLQAKHHLMPTRFQKQIIDGVQEFLGAHAYFFTEGRIPTNVLDHSKYFHIHDLQQRDGSWEATFAIELASLPNEFVLEYAKALTKGLAADAAAVTKIAFAYLIYQSYKAWKNRRPLDDPMFDRIEPILTDTNGNGAPIYDPAMEAEKKKRALYQRLDSSMVKISAPIGRSALHVDIWFDDQKLDRVERRLFSVEEEITEALIAIRLQHGYSQPQQQINARTN